MNKALVITFAIAAVVGVVRASGAMSAYEVAIDHVPFKGYGLGHSYRYDKRAHPYGYAIYGPGYGYDGYNYDGLGYGYDGYGNNGFGYGKGINGYSGLGYGYGGYGLGGLKYGYGNLGLRYGAYGPRYGLGYGKYL